MHELAGADAKLLAVSKYAPDEAVQILIDAGQVDFGESRPQQLRDRAERWPQCAWHMIGPVQKNKAKYIGRHASHWHSCDDLQTAQAVARHVGLRHGAAYRLPVLIQVNIDDVPHQRGIRAIDLPVFAAELSKLEGLQLAGLMCMAGRDGDSGAAFRAMRALRDDFRNSFRDGLQGEALNGSLADVGAWDLCMGMSGDYQQALIAGSSMVRLGSTLFADWDVRHVAES